MRNALLVAAVVFSATSSARADVTRCAGGDAAVAYAVDDLPTQSGDTGWFPGGSVAQLRLTGEIVGRTTVGMGLAPTACWDHGMSIATPGEGKTGMLDVEYGAALHLLGQIHTSILGQSIDWSGEIPVPFLPTDLLLAGTTTFDPILLPDSPVKSASVSDTTSPITVISSNVLGDIIDITGISGGLYVTVQGAMTSTYTTTAVSIGDDGVITSATGTATVATPTAGYGPVLAVAASATGNVHYAPSLVFAANFDVKILGIRVVNWQIASISMPLSAIDRPISLTGSGAQIGLPHIDVLPQQLGFANGASQPLQLHNGGAAPLMIEVTSAPSGVTAEAVTIAPGADGVLQVTAADPSSVGSAALVLSTNDPNNPSLTVALDPSASGQTNTPPADGEPSGGCNAGGGSSGALLVGFALVALAKRRRA
jgi:hypothetical protein